MNFREAEQILKEHGQEHVLRFWDELTEPQKGRLLAQIGQIPWNALRAQAETGGEISPAPCLTREKIAEDAEKFAAAGREAIRGGKLAAVLLAGGQGTRLGASSPKGTFDIGITRPRSIFEQLIRNLQDVTRACGCALPLFVMTSDKNDRATRNFFEKHAFFGYPKEYVHFFRQKMAPSVDFEGKLLLEAKDRLALSPNGNGGWYSSLKRSGLLGRYPNVEWFNVFAVDNVLQRIADPVFLGATLSLGYPCGAKVVRKVSPEERVGVFCLRDGKPSVVEYYELTEEMATARDGAGGLLYTYGVILNYLFRARELEKIYREKIPVHAAEKKIPHIDKEGKFISPAEPNGYKFETLILDMVRLMGSCLPFEVEREREFAPVKNRTGADSVDTARDLLRLNGVEL